MEEWPLMWDSNYYMRVKELFSRWIQMEVDVFETSRTRFLSGYFIAEALPSNKLPTQRAWLTDDSDTNVIVKHMFRLEDDNFTSITSAKGIATLACESPASTLGTESTHIRPDRGSDAVRMLSLQTMYGSNYTLKQIGSHQAAQLHLMEQHPKLNHFYYYSNATCKIVAKYFAADFKEFSYDINECSKHVNHRAV